MINVLICGDEKFVLPNATLISSISKNVVEPVTYYFSFFENDVFNAHSIERMKKYLRKNDRFITLCNSSPNINTYNNRWTKHIWLKLLSLYDLNSRGVKKIIHIDGDCIVTKDIKNFYHKDFSNNIIFRGVIEWPLNTTKKESLKKYICAGVLVINVENFIKTVPSIEKLIDMIRSIDYHASLPEQDFINISFKNYIESTNNYNYMFFTKHYKEEYSYKDVAILHYASSPKPWDIYSFDYPAKFFRIYWKYGRKTFGRFCYIKVVFKSYKNIFIIWFNRLRKNIKGN